MSAPLTFPPLLAGVAVCGPADPMARACALARSGCDAGSVVYNLQADMVRAAIVFAPEVPLDEALIMLPLCGVAFQNALGALAPPEVAVQLDWAGPVLVNAGRCGQLQMVASTDDPATVPDWLVVGLEVPLLATGQPGDSPDTTVLNEEGCGDVDAGTLVESWARHVLTWLHRWEEEGNAPLHAAWSGLVAGVGAPVDGGVFLGTDENFGMLVRAPEGATSLRPLRSLLEQASTSGP